MKVHVQVEHDNKEMAGMISSSIKERNSMLKDLLMEMRKMHSMSMSKMMDMMHKMKKPEDNRAMVQAIKDNGKMNQSIMDLRKSIDHLKEAKHESDVKSIVDTSNSLLKAIKDSVSGKSKEKTVVVKTVNNKSIDNLVDAIKNGAFRARERWIPSAS